MKRIKAIRRKTKVFPPSMVDQSMRDEVDVNYIMARFKKTGQIAHLSGKQGGYGDFSMMPTNLLDAQLAVKQAAEMFMSLPAVIREKFNNDPVELERYLADPRNRSEAIKYGLLLPSVGDEEDGAPMNPKDEEGIAPTTNSSKKRAQGSVSKNKNENSANDDD